MLLLLSMLIVYYYTPGNGVDGGYDNAFSSCDRSGWRWAQLYGPCWNSLIKLQPTTTWIDIAVIIGFALILLCSIALVLCRYTKLSKKYPIERFFQKVIAIIPIVILFLPILIACFFLQLYMTSSRPMQTKAISSQLSKSLLQYGHDDNITRAWHNTMRDGCCCGLHGYQDFINIGVDAPPHCECYDEEEQHCSYKGCTRQHNSDSYRQSECTASLNSNFTNAGCLSLVEDKVDSTTKYLIENTKTQVPFVAVYVLLIAVIVSMKQHHDNVYGKTTIDGYANSAKWQQIPQTKNEKETVFRIKGSTLPKILVRISIKARIIYSSKQ